MKVLADENCEREMIESLRMAGHDVVTVLDMSPSIDDETVFEIARNEGRVLLTNDHDFGLIAERAAARPPAIVLMRLERLSLRRRIEIVLRTLVELGDGIGNQFIVIEPYQVRARVYEP
jgi:predicted nuclease of predicted toxin-antitoxin system